MDTPTKLTPTSGDIVFVKDKEKTPNDVASSNTYPLCTYCKKSRHSHSKCHSRIFERYEFQLNRLMDEFDFLTNKILPLRKKREPILSLKLIKTPLVHLLKGNKFG